MSRIHPTGTTSSETGDSGRLCQLTVWKKSSMAFQGTDGFTVYNKEGDMLFRVDNYSRRSRCRTGKLVLMDGTGNALITVKPQIISLHEQWNGYNGESNTRTSKSPPLFLMRKKSLLHTQVEAQVFMHGTANIASSPDFWIEGSFRKRNCKIFSKSGNLVAEITRKKANDSVLLSDDVFNLVIQQGFDCTLIMSFVIVLDRICHKRLYPSSSFDCRRFCRLC